MACYDALIPVKKPVPERYYSRSEIHELSKRIGWTYKPYKGGTPLAKEWLEPLTGWEWIFEHEHDLDNYQPLVYLQMNGNRYAMKVNKPEVLGEIVKLHRIKHKPSSIARLSKPARSVSVPSGQEWWSNWQEALKPLEAMLREV